MIRLRISNASRSGTLDNQLMAAEVAEPERSPSPLACLDPSGKLPVLTEGQWARHHINACIVVLNLLSVGAYANIACATVIPT